MITVSSNQLQSADTDDEPSGDALRHPLEAVESRWARRRARIAAHRSTDLAYRGSVGVVGSLVLVVGVIAIPYPGPGWLIVFAGLGVLASEFSWAHRLLRIVRGRYNRFVSWFARQSLAVRGLGATLTCAVVLVTLWVLGTAALVGGWIGLEYDWLQSPLGV